MLKVQLDRSIHRQGLLALQYLQAAFLVFGLVCCLVSVMLLERLVLRRLVELGRQLSRIGTHGDLSMRVRLDGGDELTELAGGINRMLESMWHAESILRVTKFSVDHAADPIHWLDSNGRVIYANQAWCQMLGYSPEEARRLRIFDFDLMLKEDEWASRWNDLLRLKHLSFETMNRTREGQDVHVEMTLTLMDIEGRQCGCTFIRNITQRKEADNLLRKAAMHDALTGLPNRSLFEQYLYKAIERSRRSPDYRFAVMFLDLDRFKIINDSLGHQIGDKLLVAISRRLQACLRGVDVVSTASSGEVARLGGDEFVILLDGIHDIEEASAVAERLQQEMSAPFLLGGHQVHVTVSIGIVSSELGYGSPEEMVRDADTAMYRAKACGKARHVVFDRRMHEQAMARLEMEACLRGAIDNHELKLLYQPIVCLDTGKTEGFEALARWEHPKRGLISPDEFIPVAEETGLIVPLGRAVLRDVCTQLARLMGDTSGGQAPVISVNVSERELLDSDYVPGVKEILEDTRIPPELLRFEIAEGIIMERADDVLPTIADLKLLGVKLCMDDFGRGRSSLTCIHRFPIDYLKIGREFICNMGLGEVGLNIEYAAIIQAIVTLAHNLGIRVAAVGVSSAGQVAQLQSLSCDFAQGYHFSMPVSIDAAMALLRNAPWLACRP